MHKARPSPRRLGSLPVESEGSGAALVVSTGEDPLAGPETGPASVSPVISVAPSLIFTETVGRNPAS